MSTLLVDALIALKFADEMIVEEPYEHGSEEATDAHYKLRQIIVDIENHLGQGSNDSYEVDHEVGC